MSSSKSIPSRRRRGATVVEMAFVIPVFLLIVLGVVEFSRMVMVKQALNDAAQAGARTAALATTLDSGDAESKVRQYLEATVSDAWGPGTCRVSISPSELNGMDPGTMITATVEVGYNDIAWVSPSILEGLVLRAESSMTME